MGTHGKINTIWWNIEINRQKLVGVCGYELPRNLQNFTHAKRLNCSENIAKSFGGLLFLKHPVVEFAYAAILNTDNKTVHSDLEKWPWKVSEGHRHCRFFVRSPGLDQRPEKLVALSGL